jgi:mannose PTS system EIIA component
VLVLTDMYGSTPSNIATRLLQQPKTQVIAGINLPMLVTGAQLSASCACTNW